MLVFQIECHGILCQQAKVDNFYYIYRFSSLVIAIMQSKLKISAFPNVMSSQ